MNLIEALREQLGRQEVANWLGPVIFLFPRLVESVMGDLYAAGVLSHDVALGSMSPIKVALGVLIMVAATVSGFMVWKQRGRVNHWWPLVIVVALWGLACATAPITGQSVIVCAPDEDGSADESSSPAVPGGTPPRPEVLR